MPNPIQMVCVNGTHDTRTNIGTKYETISFADIARLAKTPDQRPKLQSFALIASTYNAPDARSHCAQRANGRFHAFVIDIDVGGPPLDTVDQALVCVFGDCARIIYSTSSATTQAPKWRAIVPFEQAVSGTEYEQLQRVAFSELANLGIACDLAMKGAAQMAFLPNVPPECRDASGVPLFYQSRVVKKAGLKNPPQKLKHLVCANLAQEAEAKRISETEARAKAELRARERERTGLPSPIEQFNADHELTYVMLSCGWEHRGGDWFASPFSQSKGASVRVYAQRAISFTSSDLGNVGKETPNGWVTYDAWDIFVAVEHGGNERAALEDYCDRSGYNQLRLKSIISGWEV